MAKKRYILTEKEYDQLFTEARHWREREVPHCGKCGKKGGITNVCVQCVEQIQESARGDGWGMANAWLKVMALCEELGMGLNFMPEAPNSKRVDEFIRGLHKDAITWRKLLESVNKRNPLDAKLPTYPMAHHTDGVTMTIEEFEEFKKTLETGGEE